MLDISSLPFFSKMILIIGFALGFVSFMFVMRYPIMLILMKLSPGYRESIKKELARSKVRKYRFRS
ncbi:MAG: hypothetical protein KKI06_04075 [Euryarchaeota archaeon]|nr:hypothetical protein [Euryarchaeota archaeon]MBU4222351.1 hypothetical protein [Euryarchaeota archaeon]MBU4454017.1 hypothetical protein [Euryarchaeota archaeon]MCG2735665.1 hypothetical protein [Candidatus Methanoperedenaceae archaeon]MDP3106274.1 hypothetical protein [Candidatus Methanoperedens sp.]